MNLSSQHPALIGPAVLYHLKRGKAVEKITVWFTHGQLHQYFSPHISDRFPLEMTLASGRDMEQRIDCRLFEVPWHIDVRTDEQKQMANRLLSTPAPKPPASMSRDEEVKILELIADIFEPYHALALTEFRLLRQRAALETFRKQQRQEKAQRQAGDMAHE